MTTATAPTLPPVSLETLKDVYAAYRGTFPRKGLAAWEDLGHLNRINVACHIDEMEEEMMAIEPEECFT